MATQWQTYPIEFKGGLISNLSPLQQGTNAVGSATILQNFESNKEGGYSKIKGFEKFNSLPVPGSGKVLAVKVVDAAKVVSARKNASNVTEYYYNGGNTWISMGSLTFLGLKTRHVEYNLNGINKTVFVDSVNYPCIYDSSLNTITQITGSTDVVGSELVAIFKNTAFYAKDNTLTFTAPFTVDDFSSANGAGSINVASKITGLAVFREQLIIFTKDSIKKLSGNTAADYQVSSITDRLGCLNGDSIQEVGGDIMYLAPDGIRLLSATDRIGDFGLDVASDPIAKDASIFLDNQDQTALGSISTTLHRKKSQYRIFAYIESEQKPAARGLIATKIASQGSSNISWSTSRGIKVFVADGKYTGAFETICFANSDGYVYRLEAGSSFDGLSIEAIYESPYMPITDPRVRKTFYKMTVYAQPTGSMLLNLNVKYDFGTAANSGTIQPPTQQINVQGSAGVFFGNTGTIFGTATFGGALDNVYSKNIIGSGKTIALRIEDFSTNPSFTLDTSLLEFKQDDRQ